MKSRERLLYLAVALALMAAVVFSLRLGWFDRETAEVRLPETTASLPAGEGPLNAGGLVSASVTPETVQAVIATLARPDSYSRQLRVVNRWEGGSRAWLVNVRQKGSACRIQSRPEDGDGPEKNILTRDGEITVWYDDPEESFRRKENPAASADALQMIPTYEDVLALDRDRILAAGYVLLEEGWRIMVAAREERSGYETVYYISIETGLLESAERRQGEQVIYSMTAGQADLAAPEDAFFLPEGEPSPEAESEPVTD
jgi:hypothetical protein